MVLAQEIPQPLEVDVGDSPLWLAVLIASIPAIGALVVVFLGEAFQQRRFREQRAAEDARWTEPFAGERQRSTEDRELERVRSSPTCNPTPNPRGPVSCGGRPAPTTVQARGAASPAAR
jgi:hypothetical protein